MRTQSEVVHCAGLLDELVVDPMTSPCAMLTSSHDFDGAKSPPSPTGVIQQPPLVSGPRCRTTEFEVNELGMDATWPGAGDGWAMPLLKEEEEEEEEHHHHHHHHHLRMPKRQRREE